MKKAQNMGKPRLLFSVVAVLIWPASAFVQTCFWDAGSAVRRLRGGSGGGGSRMSAYPTIDLNDGTKHPMVRERERERERERRERREGMEAREVSECCFVYHSLPRTSAKPIEARWLYSCRCERIHPQGSCNCMTNVISHNQESTSHASLQGRHMRREQFARDNTT
jgi:hypothetical protein